MATPIKKVKGKWVNQGDNPYVSTGCIRGKCGYTGYVYRNKLL